MSAPAILRSPASRSVRWPTAALLAAVALSFVAAAPQPAHAQLVTGVLTGIVRDASGEMLEGAIVSVGRRVVKTNPSGEFRLSGLLPGDAVVTVRRLGYEMRTFPAVVERGTQGPPLDVVLVSLPVGLEPVTVQARRDLRDLQLVGFYDRQHAGIGRFITREQIERRRASSFAEVLRSMVPGMRLNGSGRSPNRTVQLRNARCAPMIVIDGFPIVGGFDLTSVNPVTVLGVEVYAGPATIPARFRNFREGETCGVIAIWFGVSKPGTIRQPTAAQFAYADTAAPVSERHPVFGAFEVDEPARVDTANLVEPVYPDTLFTKGISGEVLAQFVVDRSGFVLPGSINTDTESSPEFAEAVLRALAISKFIPARKNGVPVRQVMVLPYRFVVNQGNQAR